MSQVIDTKVVEMQFDNSKFEKNIEVSLNSLKFLNKNIEDAGKNRGSLDELARASDQVGISFDNMNMKSKISLNLFDLLAGVGTKAFNRISDAVAGFALNMANSLSGMQAMRDGFNEYELKMGSVQTMLVGAKIIDPKTGKELKDDASRLGIINDELAKLNEYSDKTIYSFKDMTSNIGKFTNNGVELHDAVDAIQGVANVAAAAGANSSEASRAMYNFSQALSSGSVKLIDWKSIENANMATQGFKQSLLDTAQVLGTVVKNGKAYDSTTTSLQGKIAEAFTTTKGFNDSLSSQWMTTEVLTQTLKNYSTDVRDMSDIALQEYKDSLLEIGYTTKQVDRIIENSRKAFEAATEVKTFTQMIDTLKESLGSGWAQTFEIIIGDFMEAKKLFTDLNNTIDNLLSPIGKARNAILQMWKDNGGRQALINSFANLYHAIQNLFEPIKQLWRAFTPNTEHTGKALATVSKWIEKLTAVVRTGAQYVGKALAFILKPIIFVGNTAGKYLMKLFGLIQKGGSKVSEKLSSIGKFIKSFGDIVGKAFSKHVIARVDAFRKSISETFENLKKRVKESKAITNLVEAFKSLRDTIHDLFGRVMAHATSYASRFSTYMKKLWDAVSPLVSSAFKTAIKTLSDILLPKLRKVVGWVTDKLEALGKLLGKIDIKNSKFYKGLVELPDKIKGLTENKTLKTVFSGIKNFGSEAISFLSDKITSLKDKLEAIHMPGGLKDLFENIKNFVKSIFGDDSVKEPTAMAGIMGEMPAEKEGRELTTFQKFVEGVSGAFEWLKDAAGLALGAIKDFIGFIVTNTPKVIKSFHDFLAGEDGVLQMTDITDAVYIVSTALSNLMASFGVEKFGKAVDGISEAFGELTNSVVTLAKRAGNKMYMSALKDFAITIGILVAAMWILSKIPADKLAIASTVILVLGAALSKFFDQISKANAKLNETAGLIPIAILLIAIAGSMIAVAASLGILVGALAAFPFVIKQYNNLGDEFRDGMDRVKEVLEEIFAYLDHAASSKYSFRSAMSLLALVVALKKLRNVIINFAKEETGEAMADGLSRISQVLGVLGSFLSGVQLGSFSFINIGVDFDTVGMAAMILALGHMIKTITPAIQELAKLSPSEYKTAFKALDTIFFEIGGFIAGSALLSMFTETKLTQWLGISATVTTLTFAIGSCVTSIKTLADLASDNPAGMKKALEALGGIFLALGLVLMIIGDLKVEVKGIFGLAVTIGVMTFCVIALVPLAQSHPEALIGSVIAVGTLMIALGVSLSFIKAASGKVGVKDIFIVIGMAIAMGILVEQIRRLAKSGSGAGSIVAAGAAIGIAAMSIAGAMKLLSSIEMISPMVLAGLGLLALAIWGVAYAIMAFKGTSGQMSEASNNVKTGIEDMGKGANEAIANLGTSLDINGLLDTIGGKIGEKIKNFNLGEYIRGMIETVKADVVNWAQDFIDIGTNLIEGISTAISNPANVEKVKGAIVSLGKALLESFCLFFGIHSPSTVMAEQGEYILDGLVQGLMEFPSKLAEWVSSIGNFILDGIHSIFEGAKEKGRALVDSIGAGIQNGKTAVSKKASELGSAALKKVAKAKEWAGEALKSANSFGNKLKNSKNPVGKAAGMMIVGATNTIKGLGSIFHKSSSDATAKFTSSLNAGKGPAKSAASAIVTGVKSAFNGLTTSFKSYGTDAANGFKNGISNMISSIAAKAREMVRAAKEAAKSEQHSNSPSKDFMEYGGWAAQGYAIGMTNRKSSRLIEENARAMVDTAKNAASGDSLGVSSLYLDSNPAMSSLAYAMSQISDAWNEDMDSSVTIRPVVDMTNLHHSASAISAMFGDRRIGASMDVVGSAQNDFNNTMNSRNNAMSLKSIDKLSSKIDSMTSTMNARSLNVYNTIDGTADPSAFADELVRNFRLNARTV